MNAPHENAALGLRRVTFTDPAAQALVAQVQAGYVQIYGSPDESPLEPTQFDPPTGAFFVGYESERPVAIGGWRLRTDVTAFDRTNAAEVKRMYVVPDARGRGLARLVLSHLEATARAAGADLMVLETGPRQLEAIGLYESCGYRRITAFGHYRDAPGVRCYGKPV